MKKALIHNPYWDSLGGGERYTAAFTRLLLDSGWQVGIAWPADISTAVKSRFDIDISGAIFNSQFSILNSAKYDLLFWVSDGSLPMSLAQKTLVHFQFPFKNIAGRSPVNLLKSRLYTFVCNSRFTKSYIDREFLVRSQVVYPPVNTSAFSPGKKSKTLLYVGRFSHLTQAKNPHLLIQAFKNIHSRLPGWRLVLAGGAGIGTPSDALSRLRSQAAGLPVEIITNPSVTRLKSLYGQASIFWSASGLGTDPLKEPLKVEHFGITVVEAMSGGCVPIIPDLGGHPEIVVSGQNGFLYHSLDQLEKTTLELAADSTRLIALAKAARQRSKIFDTAAFNAAFAPLI